MITLGGLQTVFSIHSTEKNQALKKQEAASGRRLFVLMASSFYPEVSMFGRFFS
jgi:hypothetical protein